MWVGLIKSVEGIRSKDCYFLEKKEFCPQDYNLNYKNPCLSLKPCCPTGFVFAMQQQLFPGSPACQPTLYISDLPAPHSQSQFLPPTPI